MKLKDKTDVNTIKEITKNIYSIKSIEIDENDPTYIPLFNEVVHPISRTRQAHYYNDSELEFVDILTDEGFNKLRDFYISLIEKENNAMGIYLIIDTPYKTSWFNLIKEYLCLEDFCNIFKDIWKSCDYVNVDNSISKRKFLSMFKQFRLELMDEEELNVFLNFFNNQEKYGYKDTDMNYFYLYRGSNKKTNHPPINALSWTIDYKQAKFFASRYLKEGEYGTIVTLRIPRKYILDVLVCYFLNEDEVIVDFTKIKKEWCTLNKRIKKMRLD